MTYVPPEPFKGAFTCPFCSAYANQNWLCCDYQLDQYTNDESNPIRMATCSHCRKTSIWLFDELLYPKTGNAPPPNADMPSDVRKLYEEAASISTLSPRGAAALLRLAVQHLCKDLGESGKNINNDIKSLVSKGLPGMVQQALDSVRVIGNEAVHPGQIDTDDPAVVGTLFELINIIVEYMVSLPSRVDQTFSSLPEDKRDAIEKRDGTS